MWQYIGIRSTQHAKRLKRRRLQEAKHRCDNDYTQYNFFHTSLHLSVFILFMCPY